MHKQLKPAGSPLTSASEKFAASKATGEEQIAADIKIAIDLKDQLEKILRRYSKELRKYLEHAELPTTKNTNESSALRENLFTCAEIDDFINSRRCLPLAKLVMLAELMNRSITLKFTCNSDSLTVSIPLKYDDESSELDKHKHLLTQLHLNIYGVLAIIGVKPISLLCDQVTSLARDIELDGEFIDLSSIEALLLATEYRRFAVRLEVRKKLRTEDAI